MTNVAQADTRLDTYETRHCLSADNIAYQIIQTADDVDRPWIVFCTGISLNGDLWSGWHKNLVPDYNLLVFDVPGYGRSPITPAALAVRQVAHWSDYIVSLLDEIDVPVAYLVGEQTGGAAVLYTTIRHPERVLACAVISAPFQGSAFADFRREYTARARGRDATAWSDFALPRLFNGEENHPLRHEIRRVHLANDLDVLMHDGAAWDSVDLAEDLPHVTTPVLILAPGRSLVVPRSYSFELEELLPEATLVLFGACGQLLAFTEAEFASTLTGLFFARHPLPRKAAWARGATA